MTYWHNNAKEMHGWIKETRSKDVAFEKEMLLEFMTTYSFLLWK